MEWSKRRGWTGSLLDWMFGQNGKDGCRSASPQFGWHDMVAQTRSESLAWLVAWFLDRRRGKYAKP